MNIAIARGLFFLDVAIVSSKPMQLLLLILRDSRMLISSAKLIPSPYNPVHAISVLESGSSVILEFVPPLMSELEMV